MNNAIKQNLSFTLVELLVVIGILAVLTTAVILAINPLEYLKQARDTTRISDLDSIDKSLAVLGTQGVTSFGTASTVYVSIADNASSTCGSLGLPTLPSGWLYHCVNSTNLQKVDSNGWIPVDFTQSSALSLAALPIDPVNTASTGNYYTYVTGGSWELNTILESSKYRDNTNVVKKNLPGVYARGSNITLSPIYNNSGVVVYWRLDEGSGTNAIDSSGNGYNGTWSGTGTHYHSPGKVGSYSGQFNGSNDYVSAVPSSSLSGTFTVMGWGKPNTTATLALIGTRAPSETSFDMKFINGTEIKADIGNGTVWITTSASASFNYSTGTWYHVTYVVTPTSYTIYVNGDNVGSGTYATNTPLLYDSSHYIYLGQYASAGENFNGYIDDVRIYNRALSAAEIKAIYDATK